MQYSRAVASKFDKDSFIGVMPETFGGNSTIGAIELFHPYGFASRPVDMDANGACGLAHWQDGPQGYSFLLNDGRIQAKLPEIQQGESFQYGPVGNFFRCHADGSLSVFTTDLSTDKKSVYFQVKPTAIRQIAPWGSIQFDANGYHLKHVSQARIDLGAIGGLPAPLDALSSYVTLSAAVIHLEGTMVAIGANVAPHEPVAKGNTTVSTLQSISAALASIGDALTAIGAVPPITTSTTAGTAITAAVTLVATAVGAVSASVLTIPSSSVTVS